MKQLYLHDLSACAGLGERLPLTHVPLPGRPVRMHIMALGDVGMTMLIGLRLLGGSCISSIGIYDINQKNIQRLEMEMNQIRYPFEERQALPPVRSIAQEELFACDVFVFCASKGVPPVGTDGDVRMAQFEANRELVYQAADAAREARFKGLVCIVSDPVDLLSYAFWQRSGLLPEQVQGYGLGVMHARALYYAERNREFASYLTEGAAFGPHGADLVLANSVEHYDDDVSRKLTAAVVQANMEVRALGYKPYIAPALSSAALSVLLTLTGRDHYSAVYLGDGKTGAFFGMKNRFADSGIIGDDRAVPELLFSRLQQAYEALCRAGSSERRNTL